MAKAFIFMALQGAKVVTKEKVLYLRRFYGRDFSPSVDLNNN